MDSFKFREADELVSALQNDVEGIILSLRGDGEKEEKVGVPAGFSGNTRDWYWLRSIEPISHIELHNSSLNFYGGMGNKLICSMGIGNLGVFDLEEKVKKSREELRRFASLIGR